MTTYYLLPCSCGKKTEVDSGQAGLNVRCACGAELAVPTMRGLSQLERAVAPPPERRREALPQTTWGARQALIFLGLVVMLGASLPACLTWYAYPQPPQLVGNFDELNRDDIEQATLMQTWELWKELQKDFSGETEIPMMRQYLLLEKSARGRLTFMGVVAGIGVLLVVAGLLAGPSGSRKEA